MVIKLSAKPCRQLRQTVQLGADHLDQFGSESGYAVDSCDDTLARRFGIE